MSISTSIPFPPPPPSSSYPSPSTSSQFIETNSFQKFDNNQQNQINDNDDEIPFEIFDPRGLFSPQQSIPKSSKNSINSNNHPSLPLEIHLRSTDQLLNHNNPTHLNSSKDDILNSIERNSQSIQFNPPTWSSSPSLQNSSSPFHQQECKSPDYPLPNPSSSLFTSPSPIVNPTSLCDLPPHDVSPVESPSSPSSSLPYCRSPPISLSMSHSLSLPRGRSPPARFLPDSHSTQRASPSTSSSPSPPRHPISTDQFGFSQPRPNAPFSHHPRPPPIVTSGIRDLSLPSRLSHIRSSDPPGSVSSLAYSDMDASPAVNFLSAFADATVPTARTEISPVPTVPAEVLQEGGQVAGYVLGSIIGRGGFSVVREARHLLTDQSVAVKIVKRSSSAPSVPAFSRSSTIEPVSLHASICSRDRSSSVALSTNRHLVNSAHLPLPTSANEALANALLKQEIRIWSNLRHHPNIVPLISIHELSSQTLLFMPMCEGGNLLQLLNQVKLNPTEQDALYQDFSWNSPTPNPLSSPHQSDLPLNLGGLRSDLVRLIFWQIVQGLKYLHTEAGVVHKDIKLENILIQKGHVKISDFGLATYPLPERPVDVVRPLKGKSSSSWNRDLSLPKHFSALSRITEGLVTGGDPRVASWGQSHSQRPRLPPNLDNSLFSSQPVKEDEDDDLNPFQQSPLNVFPTAAGSLAYTPPEQLRSEIPLACPSLDIWALGCVLYGLLEGNLPFQDDFEPRLRLKIMNGQYEFPQALIVHPDQMCETEADDRMMIAKVLKGCLAVDRNARWVIEEIASSAWLTLQRSKVRSTLSDDGMSSDGVFEQSSISKRSHSLTSSLHSAWSIDEISMNAKNKSPTPIATCTESGSVDSAREELSASPLFADVSCTSPPLVRKNFLDLRELLTVAPPHPSSSRRSVSVKRPFNCRSPQAADQPPSPNLDQVTRPKHCGAPHNRHQNHFRVSISTVLLGSSQHSSSRVSSRNTSPFSP